MILTYFCCSCSCCLLCSCTPLFQPPTGSYAHHYLTTHWQHLRFGELLSHFLFLKSQLRVLQLQASCQSSATGSRLAAYLFLFIILAQPLLPLSRRPQMVLRSIQLPETVITRYSNTQASSSYHPLFEYRGWAQVYLRLFQTQFLTDLLRVGLRTTWGQWGQCSQRGQCGGVAKRRNRRFGGMQRCSSWCSVSTSLS